MNYCGVDCRARRMLHYFDYENYYCTTTSELRVILLYEYVMLPAVDGGSS